MKRLFILSFLLVFASFSYAQTKDLMVNSYKLKNGLTVYLNEDHSVPNVLGAVIIKTGGKYDPANHTGTSHYLEHMMFKGTDKLGTIDFEKENEFLEKISKLYEDLAITSDHNERTEIQKEINKLSLEAGKYAIPNELDRLLDQIGSSMVNAFTSDEIVAYFNMFPNNQIEKWLILYSHRFKYPVFRLFQSELETVFEEKNMYNDEFATLLFETFYSKLYKNHPYGTQTVIGSSEHVKNPSLPNMRKMFETYYVANNMALVLTGNFEAKQIMPLIDKYFGEWKEDKVPEFPEYKEEAFKGVERVNVRMSPIKVGGLGFRTVPANHKDEVVLNVCSALLNNSSKTGYLDKLSTSGKLMEVVSFDDIKNDHGAMILIFIPKILGQSLKKAEKLVLTEIKKLYTEEIEDKFFEAVKLNLVKEFHQELEDPTNRAFVIGQAFIIDKTWDEVLKYPEEIMAVTKEDVQRIASQYFSDNYLAMHSKMGFPKKEKLEKPGFDPIIPENAEAKSEFAKEFEQIKDENVKPEFINFEKDLEIKSNDNGLTYFYVENKTNDIFNIKIKFKVGTYTNPKYEQLAEYLSLVGSKDMPFDEFNKALQEYACTFDAYASDNFFVISVDGFDKYFKESLNLIMNFIQNPENDKSKLKQLKQNAMFTRRYESSSPDELGAALFEYGLYGSNSSYLRRLTTKQVANLKTEDLLNLLQTVLAYDCNIHYSGTLNFDEYVNYFESTFKHEKNKSREEFPIILPRQNYDENVILFLNDKKSLQSKIYFYIDGNINDEKERAIASAFNQYFGTGMSALVFQEIREFRSMAYSAYAVYREGKNLKEKGYLQAFVGTQADKTIDAISIMDSLINKMPEKYGRMENIKSALLQSINSSKPSWRNLSTTVESWMLQYYKEDPRIAKFEIFNSIDFKNILVFYQNNIQKRPMLITIVGNKEKIDFKELEKFGKIIEIDKKQILN
ncbi:MAG: insulinase family protein [Bacteroidales bacterium]|jgi:predicted Zn-dependent peptidase|nr:insulinase family protein [Bacteroidales bacterium]MCK9499376.1 insulinase family protein [Bacteroidales bacterium]MDY0314075.1 insulinase family protein [Bacteroidales bacterium]NLB87383.1 insulinase family protein [Bacteroidales bacterium]